MREKWYLFKSILPDTLLLILFILSFGLLEFNVIIHTSFPVIIFGLIYSDLNLVITKKIDSYQSKYIFNKTFKEGKIKSDRQLVFVIGFFKLIRIIISSSLIWVIHLLFSRSIEIKTIYMYLIIGAGIEILKTLLNLVFKFDKIIYEANLTDMRDELVKISDKLIMDYRKQGTLIDDMTESEKEVYEDFTNLYNQFEDFNFYKEIEDVNYVENYKSKLDEEKKNSFDTMRELHFVLLQIEKDILRRKQENKKEGE